MEVAEAHALVVKLVKIRCLQDGVAVGREIPVALVIGEDDDDVWVGLRWIPRAAASRQGD